jgi:hypothetical protein
VFDGVKGLHDDHLWADRVEAELERCNDPEVPASAAQRPEKVRVIALARADAAAVGENDLGGDEVVEAEAELPGEIAGPAAECVAGDPDGRDGAARRRKPVLLRCCVELAPGNPRADCRAPRRGIDLHLVHRGEVDADGAVAA